MDLANLDRAVLTALACRNDAMTYELRNTLVAPWRPYKLPPKLKTREVLAACRRLQQQGLVREAASVYVRQKCWAITDKGMAAHKDKQPESLIPAQIG